MDVNLDLRGGAKAPQAAREAVLRLAGRLPPETLQDVRLLVSELVTNSVRHGGAGRDGRVLLQLSSSDRVVRVEVSDPGPGFDAVHPRPAPDHRSGWGLVLVDRIADRWGIERGDLTSVWFEIDRDDERAAIPA